MSKFEYTMRSLMANDQSGIRETLMNEIRESIEEIDDPAFSSEIRCSYCGQWHSYEECCPSCGQPLQ